MARWCVTLLVIALAVAQVTARTVPSDAGLNDQKNVVTFGGVGGSSGLGNRRLLTSLNIPAISLSAQIAAAINAGKGGDNGPLGGIGGMAIGGGGTGAVPGTGVVPFP